MTEIYLRHAPAYDELVSAEDVDGNLPALLAELVTWTDRTVYEAGVGTGRVTQYYIDACRAAFATDRSDHMLAFAAQKLAPYSQKLTLRQADNLALPAAPWPVDLFIEGWSFGHTLLDGDDDAATTAALVTRAEQQTRPGGTIVLIETMGTAAPQPAAPDPRLATFYERLEYVYGFRRELIRTDYAFPSVAEAARVLGFFFGPEMADTVAQAGQTRVPEWTGVWWRRAGDSEAG